MQGRLRDEPLHFDVATECACCARPIRFRLRSDLGHELGDPESDPLFFVPLVDFTRLRAKSIVDDF